MSHWEPLCAFNILHIKQVTLSNPFTPENEAHDLKSKPGHLYTLTFL